MYFICVSARLQSQLLFTFDPELYVMGHSQTSRQCVPVPFLLPVSTNECVLFYIHHVLYGVFALLVPLTITITPPTLPFSHIHIFVCLFSPCTMYVLVCTICTCIQGPKHVFEAEILSVDPQGRAGQVLLLLCSLSNSSSLPMLSASVRMPACELLTV